MDGHRLSRRERRKRTPLASLACAATTTLLASSTLAQEASEPPPAESHELEGFVVEADLVEPEGTPSSTSTTVDEEQLERQEDDDVHQVLLRVPGVQVRGEDGVGLRPNIGIRGTSPNRSAKVVLLEDGVLLGPAPYSAPAAYYFPLVTRMQNVVVLKGGSSLHTGPRALGGAVDLRTAEIPLEPGFFGGLDAAYGAYGYLKAHGRVGHSSERTGYLLEGVQLSSSGFKQLDTGGPTGFDKREFMAKWRWNTSPDAAVYHQIDTKLGYASELSNETYLGLTDADFARDPYRRYAASQLDKMEWQRGQAVITHTVYPSDAVEFVTTAYRHQFSRHWFKLDAFETATLDEVLGNPDSPTNEIYYRVLTGQQSSSGLDDSLVMVDNERWYVSQGLQSQATVSFTTGKWQHEFQAGLRYHYDEVNRAHTRANYAMVSGADLTDAEMEPVTGETFITQNRGTSHALSARLFDEIGIDALTLSPGIRTEFVWTSFDDEMSPEASNQRTQVGLMPGLGVHYALTKELGVFGGAYRAFGPVAPQARSAGDAEPKPESSTNFEFGGRFSSPLWFLEVVGFLNAYQNLTASCSQARGCTPEQVGQQFDGGRANVGGIEAVAAAEPRAAQWSFPLRATYAWTRGTFLSDFDSANPEWASVERGDELTYLPAHSGSLSAAANFRERGELGTTTTIVSASRETAGQGPIPEDERTDPYAIVQVTGRIFLLDGLSVYGKVSNLLGADYLVSRRPHGARPGAPRWIVVGLKYEH